MARLCWMTFALLVSAPALSFAQASGDEPQHKSRAGDTAGAPQPASSEAQVLAKLHEANQMEMEAGGLAASRAQSAKTKQYGEQLIKDHRQADETVLAFAKRKGIEFAPRGSGADQAEAHAQNSQMEHLRARSGADFDRAFLTAMVSDHDAALRMVRNARSQTRDSEFRALLNKLLPVLQQHHDLAQRLLRSAGAASAPAS